MEYPDAMPPATTVDPAELLAGDAPFSDLATAPVVVAPEQDGPGAWAGGPSALLVGDTVYLAYRLRRPVGQGRGYANVVARSTDGVRLPHRGDGGQGHVRRRVARAPRAGRHRPTDAGAST